MDSYFIVLADLCLLLTLLPVLLCYTIASPSQVGELNSSMSNTTD